MKAACTAAEVRTILTARAFVAQAKLGDTISGLETVGIRILYLEDVGAGIGRLARLRALIASRWAART